jgi:toxin ParE1/3/4
VTGYRLSPKARDDLSNIWDYTARQWGIEQAERYIRMIAAACEDIALRKLEGRPAEDIRQGYRKWPVGSHVLYFRRERATVSIVRILHKRMDVTRHL